MESHSAQSRSLTKRGKGTGAAGRHPRKRSGSAFHRSPKVRPAAVGGLVTWLKWNGWTLSSHDSPIRAPAGIDFPQPPSRFPPQICGRRNGAKEKGVNSGCGIVNVTPQPANQVGFRRGTVAYEESPTDCHGETSRG